MSKNWRDLSLNELRDEVVRIVQFSVDEEEVFQRLKDELQDPTVVDFLTEAPYNDAKARANREEARRGGYLITKNGTLFHWLDVESRDGEFTV